MEIEKKLAELGLELPPPRKPLGTYVSFVQTGNLLYLAGAGPFDLAGSGTTGKVGDGVTVEVAYQRARTVALGHISAMREALGDLDRVHRFVKVLGMVNAAPDFTAHPKVINGYSDLMVEVFGDKGRHARSAVGMGSLPGGISVEVEAIVEVSG